MAKLTTSQGVTVEVSDDKAKRLSGSSYWSAPKTTKKTSSSSSSSSK